MKPQDIWIVVVYYIFYSTFHRIIYTYSMTFVDIIGFIGVSLILLAYFLNLNGRLQPEQLSYILMNLIGATLACIASIMMSYYPFVLLEGVWTAVSLAALIRYLRKNRGL